MDVSVIIINYNTFALTCDCIRSVMEKTSDVTVEIIVVDNASTECVPGRFLTLFPNIILVESPSNVGFSKGNNLGIQVAKGKYILLLNSDTVLKNNAILIGMRFLEANANVGVVAGRLEYPDGTIQHNCQRFPSIRYTLFELARLQKLWPRKAGKILYGFFFDYKTVAYPDWVWGTFFMFPKKLLELLPGRKLADDFFMYVEDIQWCMDFRRLGYHVAYEPSAEIIHFMGKSGGAKSELMERNMDQFMRKYYAAIQRRIISWLHRLH